MKQLNIPLLRQACKDDPKFKKLMTMYAEQRQRGRQTSTVPRIRRLMKESGTDLTRDEAISIMQLWQKANAGRYISGARDQEHRFMWMWDIPSLAQRVVAEEIRGVEPAPVLDAPKTRAKLPKLLMESPGPVAPQTVQPREKLMTIKFNGFEIELPKDMTDEERGEAESFIRTMRKLS